MKKLVFLITFFMLMQGITFAQGTGALWGSLPNDFPRSPMNTQSKSSFGFSSNKDLPPISEDLLGYVPSKPLDQGSSSTCVGHAIAHCVSIMEAKANHQTARDFSPYFVYNLTETWGCDSGTLMYKCLNTLSQKGICLLSDFPNDRANNCKAQPNQQVLVQALAHRYAPQNLFAEKDSNRIEDTKRMLHEGKPVLVEMVLLNNFQKLHGKDRWISTIGDTNPAKVNHAMLALSYDDEDQTFTVLNSWGEKWGNKGQIKISYSDYKKYVLRGYVITAPASQASAEISFFRYENSSTPISTSLKWNPAKKVYVTSDKITWEIRSCQEWERAGKQPTWNYDWYSFVVNKTTEGLYVYVFTFNAKEEFQQHYPYDGKKNRCETDDNVSILTKGNDDFPAPLPSGNTQITIPEVTRAMYPDVVGTDNICILLSKEPINMKGLANDLKASPRSGFRAKLEEALQDRLITEGIKYAPDKLAVSINQYPQSGEYIIPILIELNCVDNR